MSNRKLNLGTRLQGSTPFLEIQSFNSDNFTFDANSQVNLADSLVINDLTLNGNFINNGGGSIGGSSAEYTTSITTPKLIFTDNLAEGLIIESSDGADYIVCNSTNGSEQINLKKKVFTDGNSVILGTNSSRGILQYANIKNSTIDNTNTLSANTTGTASAWTSNMTFNLANPYSGSLASSVAFNGSSTTQLDLKYINEGSSAVHTFLMKNINSGHNSEYLQQRISFINPYSGTLNDYDTDNEIISQRDNLTFRLYNSYQTDYSCDLNLSPSIQNDMPSFNNFLYFSSGVSAGTRYMNILNTNTTHDTTTSERQYKTGIKLGNSGFYGSTNGTSDTFAEIMGNWRDAGIGQLRLTAIQGVNSSAQECGLLITDNAGGNTVNQKKNTANMVISGQQIDGLTNIKYINGCAIGNSSHLGNGLEYKDSLGSVISGDATGYDNTLELKIADDSLQTSALGLSAKLKSSGGLETDTGNGLQVQLKTGGGLSVDANGLFVSSVASSDEITDSDGSAKITVATNDQIVVKTNSANRMLINDDGRFSINNQFRMAYTTITAPNQAKTALGDIQDYLLLLGGGSQSSGPSVVSYGLGFGAVNANTDHPPAYIKYDETNVSGDSKGRLCFGARSTINGTDTYDTMWVNNGRVGIGTNNPDTPLEVAGAVYQAGGSWRYFSDNAGDIGLTTYEGSSYVYCAIKTNGSILVTGSGLYSYYLTSSDRRIKKEIEIVNDDEALNIINNLETVKYYYTDPAKQKEVKTIGFIAQEVNKVLPNACIITKEFIPDILELIENPVWEDNKLIYDIDLSGDEYTGNVLFKYQDGDEVKDIIVTASGSGDLVFEKQYKQLYCYGREVNDFHTIDKNQIFALHHSGIQELSRKNDLLENRCALLETQNGLLQTENNGLLERTQVLEDNNTELQNKISSLESLIQDLTRRVAINETTLHGLIN